MQSLQQQMLSFDGFTLNLTRGCLLGRDEEEIKLRPKSFEVLRYLVENSARLVSKDELIGAVWPGTAVTDDSLVQCLIEVRRALGDSGQRIVRTVPRRGYIFEPEVVRFDFPEREIVYTEEIEAVRVAFEEEEKDQQSGTSSNVTSAPTSPKLLSSKIRPHGLTALLILVTLGTLIIAFAYFATRHYFVRGNASMAASSGANIRSIAVLPLENLSGDPAQDYFADGMTEELISNLTQIRALKVISRTSVMRYKANRGNSLPEIATRLNVDAVIEGTVQRSGGRVHVTARLIPAATDSPSWSREYDREEGDVLRLESEVARAVADEIQIQLTAEERARLGSARSVNPQAQEANLLGRYHFNKSNEEDSKRAIEYFEHAIQLAPDYAAPYAGLSDAWLERATWENTFKEVEAPARTAALKAIELDGELAEAHVSLAKIKLIYDLEWTTAEQEFKRALDLNQGSVDAHIYYGFLLSSLARHDEAIQQGQIAGQLDPLSSGASVLGRLLYRARRYQEAVPYLQRGIELEPRSARAYYRLGDTYAKLARYDEAIAAYRKIGELAPNSGYMQAGTAYVYALMGRQREARQIIKGLKANPSAVAQVCVALGDKDEAFRLLGKAIEERPIGFFLSQDPAFESLYSDPRWQTLLRRMNLPQGIVISSGH